MSETQSAFFTRDTACPACKEVYPQRHIRLRAVMPLQKESDQHIIEYKWANPQIQQVHPSFYFLHYCPQCFYTDTIEDFETPDNSEYSRWSIKCHREAQKQSDPALSLLGTGVDYNSINFESAMRMHFLAAYIQLQSPADVLDCYKIGRLFLRIAWLYRERGSSVAKKSPDLKVEVDDSINSDESPLSVMVLKGFNDAEQVAYEGSSVWTTVVRTIRKDVETRLKTTDIPFKGDLDAVGASLEDFLRLVKAAKNSYLHHMAAEEESISARSISTDFTMSSAGFLEKIKLMWPLAPTTEKEAMRTAVRYFEKALSSDPRFDDMESYFRVASLSVDLLMRCGEIDTAFGFVRGIHSSCMETRQVYMDKLKEEGITEDRKKKIKVLMSRNNATLECALDLRGELMNNLVERERSRIEGIAKKYPQHPGKAVEEELVKSGVPSGIISYIKDPKNKCDMAQLLLRK